MLTTRERRLALINAIERLAKKEIEWCYNEEESDDWSKFHDQVIILKNKYLV